MKFTVSSSALHAHLSTMSRVVNDKSTMPILGYFLFEVTDSELRITAADTETRMVTEMKLEKVEQSGSIAVPKSVVDLLKELPEQPITFEADEQSWNIVIRWRNGESSLPGASAASYPEPIKLSGEKKLNIEADTLLSGIEQTIFAVANDSLRPVMNGIYFDITASKYTFVATDAHRLVCYEVEAEAGTSGEASFILPQKPANLLRNLLAKEQEKVEVSFDDNNAIFKMTGFVLACRLIEGKYPNYSAVIPANNPHHIIADRTSLLSSVKLVAVSTDPATGLIRFDLDSNQLTMTAHNLDYATKSVQNQQVEYSSEPLTIGFKAQFLVDTLSNLDSESVKIELGDSSRAGLFRPVYEEKPVGEVVMILMPMLVNL